MGQAGSGSGSPGRKKKGKLLLFASQSNFNSHFCGDFKGGIQFLNPEKLAPLPSSLPFLLWRGLHYGLGRGHSIFCGQKGPFYARSDRSFKGTSSSGHGDYTDWLVVNTLAAVISNGKGAWGVYLRETFAGEDGIHACFRGPAGADPLSPRPKQPVVPPRRRRKAYGC